MAYFAKIENNVVVQVATINDNDIIDHLGTCDEDELLGEAHCKKTYGGTWKQCSYNTFSGIHRNGGIPRRANFPSVGWIYDSVNDIFHGQRPIDVNGNPCDSWIVNPTTGEWEPPFQSPTLTEDQVNSKSVYLWDESDYKTDNTTGWVLQTP